jgi:hypothetical protein
MLCTPAQLDKGSREKRDDTSITAAATNTAQRVEVGAAGEQG